MATAPVLPTCSQSRFQNKPFPNPQHRTAKGISVLPRHPDHWVLIGRCLGRACLSLAYFSQRHFPNFPPPPGGQN